MENYFFLLELSFDPPENDEQKISAAIKKKQTQWAQDMINPVKKTKASAYMAEVEQIKKVMLNPSARGAEAAKAKQIKQEKTVELQKKLELYQAKGDVLAEKDLKQLLKLFQPYGFTEKEIQDNFHTGGKKENFDPNKVLDATQARNIQNWMKALDMQDQTLYELLELPQNSSCSALREKAIAQNKIILEKGEKTGRDNAIQSLCGLCSGVIFKNEVNKAKYDNYLNLTKYRTVNESVDEMARSNSKVIEPQVKEKLMDIAVREYHIGISDASTYIDNYCDYMGYSLVDSKIICGLCQTENPAGSTHCIKCGKPLIIICPSCGYKNNNSAKSCAKCRFDLTGMDRAIKFLDQAKDLYTKRNLSQAEEILQQAKLLWPNHEEILSLERQIEEDRKAAEKTEADILHAIQDKKYYEAREKLNQAKISGFPVDETTENQVMAVLENVEKQLQQIRSASDEEAFQVLMELREIISDSKEVNEGLKKYPPKGSGYLEGTLLHDSVTLHWGCSPSVGDISYKLVKKADTPPNGPNDGTVIYTGKELLYTDQKLKANTVFYFAVFAVRAGVYSKATHLPDGVANVDKIKNLHAIGGNCLATLSWEPSESIAAIRLWKYCGTQRPNQDGDFEEVPCSRLDGATVDGLTNGLTYWFAVSAGHIINGKVWFSEREYISASPVKPANPLEDFTVQMVDEIFMAKWAPTEWDVILFFTKKKPEYAIGSVYDIKDLSTKYEKIDINLKSKTEAEFRLNFIGECYIIPGVICASNVVLNAAFHVVSVPDVRDISFDSAVSGTELYVNFAWPKKINRAMLVYRMDDYPVGPNDPLGHKIDCSKKQYDMNAGIILQNPPEGILYSVVYTFFENDEGRIYSNGVRTLLGNEPQKDVYYSLKYKKASIFNKISKLTVIVEISDECVFPPFAIISKYKSTPLNRTDGTLVCSVEENTEIHKTRVFEFNLPEEIRKDSHLKLFFLNNKYYKSFKVACKEGNIVV